MAPVVAAAFPDLPYSAALLGRGSEVLASTTRCPGTTTGSPACRCSWRRGASPPRTSDPEVKRIAERWPTGGIDQLREVLWHPRSRPDLLKMLD
ncbi:MAG TPA: hypothetical protein VEQ66_14915 [Propionibacteriaceae bacterium]|nr:hypothetical protein [Propionibacteriaceae bacterium]